MRVSALDDQRNRFPSIFIRGSRILAAAEAGGSGSATIGKFRTVIEDALLSQVAEGIAKEAASALKKTKTGVPAAVEYEHPGGRFGECPVWLTREVAEKLDARVAAAA